MITTGLLIAATVAATAGIVGEVKSADANIRYNQLVKQLQDIGYTGTVDDAINQAVLSGRISRKDAEAAASYMSKILNSDSNKNGLGYGETLGLSLSSVFSKNTDRQAAIKLMDLLGEAIPSMRNATMYLENHIEDYISGAISSLPGIPAPSYEDVNFVGQRIQETPAYLMRGQEMADLYKMNYDPNYYYDLIKQGTEANVALAQYENEQAWNAAAQTDEAQRLSYLDSLRNTKSEAIAKGATEGSIAANEVLNNLNSINSFLAVKSNVATNTFNNMQQPLLDNSQARLTADTYYNSLANIMATNALLNYSSDVDRYGQEMLSNAEMFTADQYLRGQRSLANANMASAYNQAAAQRAAAADSINQYWRYLQLGLAAGDSLEQAIINQNRNAIRANTGSDSGSYIQAINR